MEILLFFGYGILEDMLAATYNKCVGTGHALGAGLAAVAITMLSVFVLSNLLFDFSLLSPKLWGFAMGNLAGSWAVVKYWKRKERRS